MLAATDYDDPDEGTAADEREIANTPETQTPETVSVTPDSASDTVTVNTPTEQTTNPFTGSSATELQRGLLQEQITPSSFLLPTSSPHTSTRLAMLSTQNQKHQDATTPSQTSVNASFHPEKSTAKALKAVISDKKTRKSAFSGQKPPKTRFLASQTPYYVHYTADNDPIIIMADNNPSDPLYTRINALKPSSTSKNSRKPTFSSLSISALLITGGLLYIKLIQLL